LIGSIDITIKGFIDQLDTSRHSNLNNNLQKWQELKLMVSV